MGDPKKIRKKYQTPRHPWIKSRIIDERRLKVEYGTRNKKEIWKMETFLKNFKTQAKRLIILRTEQADIETKNLFRRVKELGFVKGEVDFDSILGLTLDDVMERRLQTIVFRKGLAKTPKQARQFIVHEHILVDGKKLTSPSYIVSVKEQSSIEFSEKSPFFDESHPERSQPEIEELAKKKEAEKKVKQVKDSEKPAVVKEKKVTEKKEEQLKEEKKEAKEAVTESPKVDKEEVK